MHKALKLRYEVLPANAPLMRNFMPLTSKPVVRTTLLLAAIGLAISGCGRKGDLDPPSAHATKTGDATKPTKQPGKQDKPFFLDPLL